MWSGHDRSQAGWSVCPPLLRVRLFPFCFSNVSPLPPSAFSSCHRLFRRTPHTRRVYTAPGTRPNAPLSPDWAISLSCSVNATAKRTRVRSRIPISRRETFGITLCGLCPHRFTQYYPWIRLISQSFIESRSMRIFLWDRSFIKIQLHVLAFQSSVLLLNSILKLDSQIQNRKH